MTSCAEILYLSNERGPHPAHKPWIKVLKAQLVTCIQAGRDPLKIALSIARTLQRLHCGRYSIAIAEGLYPLVVGYFLKKLGFVDRLILVILGPSIITARRFLATILSQIDGIIAVSHFVANIFLKLYNQKIPLAVAHPVPDTTEFLHVTPSVGSKRACFVGTLTKIKGADLLPYILHYARKVIKDMELLVIGSGPLRMPIVSGLHYIGSVPREKIKEVMAKCAIYLHPARFDAFPASVIEAMAVGLIPIITEMAGSKEAVKEIDSALVVPVNAKAIADKVIEVLSLDEDEKRKLSNKAKEVAMRYSKLAKIEILKALKSIMETWR